MSAPSPTTAAEINAALTADHYVSVEKDGVRYLVSIDEDVTGVYAWPDGERAASRSPFPSFGEGQDEDESYGEVSRAVAAWLASARVTP